MNLNEVLLGRLRDWAWVIIGPDLFQQAFRNSEAIKDWNNTEYGIKIKDGSNVLSLGNMPLNSCVIDDGK